jgi:hypothetical protein
MATPRNASGIVSLSIGEKYLKMMDEVLAARGFPSRGRSAYVRACIESDHRAFVMDLHKPRRKAITTPRGKTR